MPSAVKDESFKKIFQAHSATRLHFRWLLSNMLSLVENQTTTCWEAWRRSHLETESYSKIFDNFSKQLLGTGFFFSWSKGSSTSRFYKNEKLYLVPCLLNVWLYTDTHATIPPPSPIAAHSPSLRNRPLQMSLPCWLGKPQCHSCRSSLWKNPAKSLLFGFCSSQWPLHRRKHGEYDFDRHVQHGSMEWFLQSHHRARSEKQVKVQKEIIFCVASKAQLALQTSNSENAKAESLIELQLILGSGWMLIVKISKASE